MSDDDWNQSVAKFQKIVDSEASDDRSIQVAWDTLRQDYRNKFNAKVSPHATQQNEEPFGLWAAENLSGHTLDRVLCLIFRKELAECNHITLLRSTAAKANTTVGHILLYFGASMFSESLLGHVRKRIRVFDKDPVSGSSAFKNAYLKVLRATAQRTKVALDTTSIAAPNPGRIFSSPDLTTMASANPEFDPPSMRRPGSAIGSSQVQGQGAKYLPSVLARDAFESSSTDLRNQNKKSSGSSSILGREDGLLLTSTGGEVIKPSIESNTQDRQPGRAGHISAGSRFHRAESEGQRSYLPSVAPMPRPIIGGHTSTRRNPPRKGRPSPYYAAIAPTNAGDVLGDDDENTVGNGIKAETSAKSQLNRSVDEDSQTRVGSTIHCAQETLQATSKRPLHVEEDEANTTGENWTKRLNKRATRSDLLDQERDWDDETVLIILKQLEATCRADYIVVDGMRDGNTRTQPQITGEAGKRGSLLVPLKLADGQRLLAVVDLDPPGKPGKGVMRYYDPGGPPDEDAVAKYIPAMKLILLLTRVLPGRDHDPALWKSEYCVCPELSCEKDMGLSICLEAMYAVGGRPLPDTLDWVFWNHLLLGAFFPDDKAVQMRVAHYRDNTVYKLIRQGQMSDAALVPQGRLVSSDIEYLGTAAMNPVDRIECRADNTKKILGVIHEGCRVFHNLQEQLDIGKADLKTRLDKSTHIRDSLRHKLNIGDKIVLGAPPTKIEDDDETAESFNRITLQQAIEEHSFCKTQLEKLAASTDSIRNALHELAIWRREVNAAVLEDDACLSDKHAG